MRRIILNVAVSLDGLIEGPNGEYDWCYTDQDYGMKEFMQRVDTVFFGRKSYELMIKVEPNAYPDKQKYVFSNTMSAAPDNYNLISGNTIEVVKQMKSSEGKHIWLFGGAVLTTALINAGLLDELILSVHPIILGAGKPLFSGIRELRQCKLREAKTFESGLVQMSYEL